MEEEGSEVASPLDRLAERCAKTWPAILKARKRTDEYLEKLQILQEFSSDNTSVVVFGSFARRELTSGSDVDWSLLIDGPSDPAHFRIAQEVKKVFDSLGLQKPGTTDTFGALASSHELIHHIGGVRDTNQNTTRRMLLLLESRAITKPIFHERVVRGILNRYITDDVSVSWSERAAGQPVPLVPRFLLNDVARFWRTMAVDYAAKRWEQSDKKWALRNSKLRMSRKLLFAAGLLMCFNFDLRPPDNLEELLADPDAIPPALASFFLEQMRFTPIDIVSNALLISEEQTVSKVMDAYDRFLEILDDNASRKQLEDVKFDQAADSVLFQEIRHLSHQFQEGLTELFFDGGTRLRELAIKYGVF
ncbi:MAG TPA: nucleotidyltransferase domain-containing protein [Thermoanaerobaculia bacterium]|jgi:predicted nucleotidyltransferase|nr:nucleotidyltransferase domain-containing protein [Thermoanaerobaculia bacterium]